MPKLIRCVLSILGIAAFTLSINANAGPIINGREWYQPNDLTNYSWADFDATCPSGLCNGHIGGTGPDLTGWVWASVYEVGDLFHATTPHPGGIGGYTDATPLQSPDWVFQFFGMFDPTFFIFIPEQLYGAEGVIGLTSTKDDASGLPYWGILGAYTNGLIALEVFEIDGTVQTELSRFGPPPNSVGAWLYRADTSSVPAPDTMLLFLVAACAFLIIHASSLACFEKAFSSPSVRR